MMFARVDSVPGRRTSEMRCVQGLRYRLRAFTWTTPSVLRRIMGRETRWGKITVPLKQASVTFNDKCDLNKDVIRKEFKKERRILEIHIPSLHNKKPLLLWAFAAIGCFAVREGLVCPVICYSVNHISGEMDLLACPLQRNEGQPLPLRGHLQHGAIVNVKH